MICFAGVQATGAGGRAKAWSTTRIAAGAYASDDYRNLLKDYGMQMSMSRKGDCWDNAPMESFFGTLKKELVHHRRYRTREEARRDIFDYIEIFYNRERLHSSLGYLSPVSYEEIIAAKQAA